MPQTFTQQLRRANNAERKAKAMKAYLDICIDQLREVCPHLAIAWTELGGPHTRVCQSCGIQETAWDSDFKTLTAPGGSWFQSIHNRSKDRRKGQAPVLYPMAVHEAYAYRRGSHKDVSED